MSALNNMTKKDSARIPVLHRIMTTSKNAAEADRAHAEIVAILKKYGLKFKDLAGIMAQCQAAEKSAYEEKYRRQHSSTAISLNVMPGDPNKDHHPLDLVHALFERHLDMKPHEYIATALWTLHTFIYSRYQITPRLAVLS